MLKTLTLIAIALSTLPRGNTLPSYQGFVLQDVEATHAQALYETGQVSTSVFISRFIK